MSGEHMGPGPEELDKTTPIEPLSAGLIEIDVQRHDDHKLGHLTPEGHEHARQEADRKVGEYLDANPNTHFMVMASDQPFDSGEPEFGGLRAKETADEIIASIRAALEERGLPPDQLFGTDDTDPVTLSPTLREAGIFPIGGAIPDMKAAFPENYMGHLKDEAASQQPEGNPWQIYYEDPDPKTREEMGAEDPKVLATRMEHAIQTAEMVGASLHRVPGKEDAPLAVIIVGHGGGLDSYLRHKADVPLEELGFPFSGGFTLESTPEGVVAVVKGKQYLLKADETPDSPA